MFSPTSMFGKIWRRFPKWEWLGFIAVALYIVSIEVFLLTAGGIFVELWGYLTSIVLSSLSAVFIAKSFTRFFRWYRKKVEEGRALEGKATGLSFVFVCLIVAGCISGVSVLVAERAEVIYVPLLHIGELTPVNPFICVNDTPSFGVTLPYPEVLELRYSELRSIQVCPRPYSTSMKVSGLRYNGKNYPFDGKNKARIDFDPPLQLTPFEDVEVVVIGRALGGTNSVLYVIRRVSPLTESELGLEKTGD